MLTAAEALFLTPFVGGLAFIVICLIAYVARTDDADADHDPHAELHCLDDADAWPDDPRFRADVAKARRQNTQHRMNEEAWKRATGQDIA